MNDKNNNNQTPGEPGLKMTTSEMLELAGIDALGLLDDAEHAAFGRAFAQAPGAVRELVWAEQARIAELGIALPDGVNDPAQRARFLDQVRAEIAKANQPTAKQNRSAGRALSHDASHSSTARHESRGLGLRRAKRVGSFWRVVAVGASVAAVVLAVLQVQLRQEYDRLENNIQIASLIDSIGIEHVEDALFSGVVQKIHFASVGATGRAQATLQYNPDRDSSRLYVMNLESRTNYTVVTVDEKNVPTGEILTFETDDLLTSVDLSIPGQPGQLVRVAIMSTDVEPRVLFVASIRLA